MTDKGFTIEEDLKPLGVSLNIPSFLDGRDQIEEEEVIESQAIASVRIHVERLMSRVKSLRWYRLRFLSVYMAVLTKSGLFVACYVIL